MTRKEWILANLEGKVQLRALRACEEQNLIDSHPLNFRLSAMFGFGESKENYMYWYAIDVKLPNPDQYLPEGYVDVDTKKEPNYKEILEEVLSRLSSLEYLSIEVVGKYEYEVNVDTNGDFVDSSEVWEIQKFIETKIS